MKKLSNKSERIFLHIIGLLSENNHVKIDNSQGAFMPLSVEFLYQTEVKELESPAKMYSFAHYYKQNGDLVPDPDMTLLHVENIGVFPCSYQDFLRYQESLFFEDEKWKINRAMQRDHASFCELWMQNIKEQQELKI